MNWLIVFVLLINIGVPSHSKSNFELRKMKIMDLSPTQSSVGVAAVNVKKDMLSQMDDLQLEEYLKNHPVPLVLAPNSKYYLVDHHHLCTALLSLNIGETYVEIWDLSQYENGIKKIEKKGSKSKIKSAKDEKTMDQKMDEFWRQMKNNKFVYLKEQGKTTIAPKDLPSSILDLQDDPFRSFAYFFRDFGGYKKVSIPFLEFMWGDFLRGVMSLSDIKMPMTVAELTIMKKVMLGEKVLDPSNEIERSLIPFYGKVNEALQHAKTPGAVRLPGSKYKTGSKYRKNGCYKFYY